MAATWHLCKIFLVLAFEYLLDFCCVAPDSYRVFNYYNSIELRAVSYELRD